MSAVNIKVLTYLGALAPDKVDELEEILTEFAVESGQAESVDQFYFREAADHLRLLLEHGAASGAIVYTATCEGLITPIGAAAYVMCEDHGFRRKKAQELFIYVLRPYRRGGIGPTLIEALENQAKADGINLLYLAHLAGDDRIGRYYVSQGYRPAETGYVKLIQ